MEIRKLKSGFYDVKRIGDDSADDSGYKRMDEIMACMLVLLFKVFKCPEEGVTTESCLEYSGYHSFVKALPAVLFVNELGGVVDVYDEIIIKVQSFRGYHKCHFNVLERLEDGRGDDSTDHTKYAILTYHYKFFILNKIERNYKLNSFFFSKLIEK